MSGQDLGICISKELLDESDKCSVGSILRNTDLHLLHNIYLDC
jgi:hypothetical protein